MQIWQMTIAKTDLIEAIDGARKISTWRKRRSDLKAFPLIITAGPDGLAFRSADAAYDVSARGSWPSPIRVPGAVLHALAPRLDGPEVTMVYADGKLVLGRTVLDAVEV
ncbi:hypothetical protein GON01_07130 [Sphingomonas sp. MAH-20]|jgi:hypothetical protein|uniref:Uncharacterized protein n=1 Tax=Sphingomonas horti TaxID=2682842 RepID=A0A6I4IZV2_9SPHN|nr:MULTISPECIES: hypothetical protein [Sphingomonas]MBA2920771.1 hypothetical protein [Sphingomonas sp. CGMCC 1.13658]MVO77707.1 hypothetical protein [Sphingomonas horti]